MTTNIARLARCLGRYIRFLMSAEHSHGMQSSPSPPGSGGPRRTSSSTCVPPPDVRKREHERQIDVLVLDEGLRERTVTLDDVHELC